MGNKILFIDTETGGLEPQKHDLLSVGLVVWDNGEIPDEKEILVLASPERITPRSLEINQIDIDRHNRKAISPQAAVKEIIDFVTGHFASLPVKVAGHNVAFDLAFIKQLFQSAHCDFYHYFSHRSIDTSTILTYLSLAKRMAGKDAHPITDSSDEAFRRYQIRIPKGKRHTALADAKATASLFSKLLNEWAGDGSTIDETHIPAPQYR